MGWFDAFRYDAKRVLVVGGASGMGAAVVDLVLDAGGAVVALDRAPIDRNDVVAATVDLADTASIEAVVAQAGGTFHAVFACAGVADGTPGIERINFLGNRHLVECLLAQAMLPRGSAIGFISSAGGIGWENSLDELHEYLDVVDIDAAAAWALERFHADYIWSKKAINLYVARRSLALLRQGIRINAIMPGPTDTPLARANQATWLDFGGDYRQAAGIEASTPMEQACALVFLCSDAASAITGTTLISDVGYFAAGVSGSFPPAKEAVDFLRSI